MCTISKYDKVSRRKKTIQKKTFSIVPRCGYFCPDIQDYTLMDKDTMTDREADRDIDEQSDTQTHTRRPAS